MEAEECEYCETLKKEQGEAVCETHEAIAAVKDRLEVSAQRQDAGICQ
jgi:hypothetical protein